MNGTASASREILWNVSSLHTVILMYSLLLLAGAVAMTGIIRRIELWSGGKSAPEFEGDLLRRSIRLAERLISQRLTNRDRSAAQFHTLLYLGFVVLTFTTTMVMLDHDFGIRIYRGSFYLAVTVLSDLFGLGLLFGVLLAAKRRYLDRPDKIHSRLADGIFLWWLAILVIQGFILEGLRIYVTRDPWAAYSPVGWAVAQACWAITPRVAGILHKLVWWVHTTTVFAGFAVLPYSKLFHIIASSANLFFRESERPKGTLAPVGDIEQLLESGEEPTFGLGTLKDYSWKQLLELDACTSCGRCQAVCPAYTSGKPLSPKWLILDTRNHMLAVHAQTQEPSQHLPKLASQVDAGLLTSVFFPQAGIRKDETTPGWKGSGAFRGDNAAIHDTVRALGVSPDARIAGEVIDPMTFWSCTTCRACVEACPVGINHVDHIVGNRRNMVLMHGEIPSEATATLRALETRGNPYGSPSDRMNWAAGLNVPIIKPGDTVDYLYWVGCVSAYDQKKQKIARSIVTLLNEAGVSFGVLGNDEWCTGDPARRLGEENLYQTLAKRNIEILKNIKCSFMVANCPHCFNTIKNEYPEFGFTTKMLHHSQLLSQLVADGKIPLKPRTDGRSVTFHDPCYLGRYNDEVDAPRSVLRSIPSLKILEMERSKEKGLCCGAGGGHFWMDLKKGERVNVIRTQEAADTGASIIATGCPFCHQMMDDGTKLTNRDDIQVKDIAELLVEQLDTAQKPQGNTH
jgi:Fe-S oxidoreductase/nitrate reductase gamma subunit